MIFKRPEDFKRYVSLLTNATREGFKALATDLAGKKQDNNWLYMQATAAIIRQIIKVCCHRITNEYKIEYESQATTQYALDLAIEWSFSFVLYKHVHFYISLVFHSF